MASSTRDQILPLCPADKLLALILMVDARY